MGQLNAGLLDPNAAQRGYQNAFQAFEQGAQAAIKRDIPRAIADLRKDPTNEKALSFLYSHAPGVAAQLEKVGMERTSRNALADYMLGAGGPAAPGGGGNALLGGMGGPGAIPAAPGRLAGSVATGGPQAPSAYERAVRADPEAFLTFEGKRTELTHDQLKMARELNDAGMQILGGVTDQASFEAAKEHGRALYGRFGLDFDALGVPDTYSPDTIHQLQLRGMETKDQLAAVARENKLEWDIEDDIQDNASQDEYRQGQLGNVRRGQDLTHTRGLRGQDIASRDRVRGQDVKASRGASSDPTKAALSKFSAGQPLTEQEKVLVRGHFRKLDGKRGRGRGRAGSAAAASPAAAVRTATNPQTGEKVMLVDGKWVPMK